MVIVQLSYNDNESQMLLDHNDQFAPERGPLKTPVTNQGQSGKYECMVCI